MNKPELVTSFNALIFNARDLMVYNEMPIYDDSRPNKHLFTIKEHFGKHQFHLF